MVTVGMDLELVHLLAVQGVALTDSLVNACLDDLAVKMVRMVAVDLASFDEHLVGLADEAFLYYNNNKNNKFDFFLFNFQSNLDLNLPCGGIPGLLPNIAGDDWNGGRGNRGCGPIIPGGILGGCMPGGIRCCI